MFTSDSQQLTAFAYKDYLQFGYVDQGISDTADLLKQFNINTYAPTMLVFKENIDKPADIIQVHASDECHVFLRNIGLNVGPSSAGSLFGNVSHHHELSYWGCRL